MSKFRYILRYYIDPNFHEDDRIAELVDYCQSATVDEVMLFFNAEERFTCHYTLEDLDEWLPLAKKIKAALSAINVDLSVNPWTTLVHCARGRKLKPGQNYNLMIGDSGKDNGITACPLDSAWLADLAALWGKVAGELQPTTIWLEDDFRLHNHGAVLGHGGCYCQQHLDEFARRSGCQVSRQELLVGLWGANFNPQWRKIWQELNNETFLHNAEVLKNSITAASPATAMGLMASGFDVASDEGRNWKQLQAVLTTSQPMSFRPSMSPYTETWPMRKIPCNARMTVAALNRPLKIYPELESGPRHGAYSLGTACAAWQLLEAASFGAHGITMNCYDMLGSGIAIDPRLGKVLGANHRRLDALAALGVDDNNFMGARILISEQVSRHAPGNGVRPQCYSTDWGRVASILGFTAGYVQKVTPSDEPYLVNSHTLLAFSDEEIAALLSQKVILDAVAVTDLIQRGFGPAIGITAAALQDNTEVPYSYEEILIDDLEVYPQAYPRMTAQRAAESMTAFTCNDDAVVLSKIRGGDHSDLFPGAVRYQNSQGGTIISLAYALGDQGGDEWFYFGFFNVFRRLFMQDILRKLAPAGRGAFVENEPLRCYLTKLPTGELFAAALNSTTDTLDGTKIRLTNITCHSAQRLLPNGTWTSDGVTLFSDGTDTILQTTSPITIYEGEFFRLLP